MLICCMLQCNSCTCNDPKYYVLLGDKAIELTFTIKLFRVSNLTGGLMLNSIYIYMKIKLNKLKHDFDSYYQQLFRDHVLDMSL